MSDSRITFDAVPEETPPAGGSRITFDATPEAQPAAPQKLSTPPAPPSTLESIRAAIPEKVKRMDAQAGDFFKSLQANAASVGDMILGLPTQALGVVRDMSVRAQGVAAGKAPALTAKEAQAEREKFVAAYTPHVFERLYEAVNGGGKDVDQSHVNRAMAYVTNLVDEEGGAIERATGGTVRREDVNSLFNEGMALLGLKPTVKGVAKLAEAAPEMLRKAKVNRLREMEPVEAAQAAQADVRRAEMAAQTQTALRSADDLTVDALRGELKPKPRPKDVPTLPLESAVEKVAEARPHELTAEERLSLKEAQVEQTWKAREEQLAQARTAAEREAKEDALYALQDRIEAQSMRGGRQAGGVDPKLLARMAAIGLGAWAGAYFSEENQLRDAVFGALGAAALSRARPIAFAQSVREGLKRSKRDIDLSGWAQEREDMTKLTAIDTWTVQRRLEELVPDAARRAAVTDALEQGKVADLPPKEQQAAAVLTDMFDPTKWRGIDSDVLETASAAFDRAKGGERDASILLGMYSNALTNAIANKQFFGRLREAELPNGRKLVEPVNTAPSDYVSVNHPFLQGVKVHPEIEGQLKVMFDTTSPGSWMKAASAVSDVTKRLRVSFSLFHMKSLAEAALIASSHPIKTAGVVLTALFSAAKNDYLNELKKGSAAPLVQRAVHGGVGLTLERQGVGIEDSGMAFYDAMHGLQDFANQTIPGAGNLVRPLIEVNHKVDTVMWARLHTALKLMLFDEKYHQLMENSARRAEQGKGRALTEEEAGKIAGSFANDIEGGLNYRKIAMEAQTRFGRQLAEHTFTPGARRGLQIAFFAPDWNLSTIRSVVNAFGPGSGLKGMVSPSTLADLHRQYIAKSALYYFTLLNALNIALSGHQIWQNKDWTQVDMDPQGNRHLQVAKHMMEVPRMLKDPRQEALNKLGFVPSEAANQLLGTEYLHPRTNPRTGEITPGPAMRESRLAHLGKSVLPFSAQPRGAEGLGELALTTTGLAQISGMTPKQKEEEKERRRQLRERLKRAGVAP